MNGTDPSQGIREPLAAAQTEARPVTRRAKGSAVAAPRLRPPTLMIDLLFGALMLFAFQMGNPNAQRIAPYEIELPTSDVRGAEDTLLASCRPEPTRMESGCTRSTVAPGCLPPRSLTWSGARIPL